VPLAAWLIDRMHVDFRDPRAGRPHSIGVAAEPFGDPSVHPTFVALPGYREYPADVMKRRATEFYEDIRRRRTVREFSGRPVAREVIEDCLRAAGTAPSGANMQPWHFVVVADPAIKREIRLAAEAEEREFYHHKAPQEWLDALAPLGTNDQKPFLEAAPYLIVVFAQTYGVLPDGRKVKHYYAHESVGIATGILITAVHRAGLVSLTHTPSPMGFLNAKLHRPPHERPFLILVVGYPADGATVPVIAKKPLDEIASFV
jgi:nitroreductase